MTQKNAKILSVEDTPYGKYLQAEVDGGFSRDVLEFLVKGDTTVTYRAMATKVTYVYPFTTAFGDSEGQEQRLKQIVERLGWSAPILDFEDQNSIVCMNSLMETFGSQKFFQFLGLIL